LRGTYAKLQGRKPATAVPGLEKDPLNEKCKKRSASLNQIKVLGRMNSVQGRVARRGGGLVLSQIHQRRRNGDP